MRHIKDRIWIILINILHTNHQCQEAAIRQVCAQQLNKETNLEMYLEMTTSIQYQEKHTQKETEISQRAMGISNDKITIYN
jgi:hypothetical protein